MPDRPHPTGRKLLGTPIFEVEVGEEPLTLVSDLHLRPGETDKLSAFEALLGKLREGSCLVVLGDLLDFWVGPRQLPQEGWREIPALLRGASERGIRSFFLHGNRDFMLGGRFEAAAGGRVVPGGLLIRRRNDMRLLCLHGDELCLEDRAYQRAKGRLRSLPVRLLLHLLPFALSRRLAEDARRRSLKAVSASDPEKLRPRPEALARTRMLGEQDLCFGHIHRAESGLLPGEGAPLRYYTLPAFEEGAHAIWDSALELRDAEGPLPWPAPAPLPGT